MAENPLINLLMGLANPGVPRELWNQARPWFLRFMQKLPETACVGDLEYCEHVTRGGNDCEHLGILECRACHARVCLKHSYIGAAANCICAECGSDLLEAAREEERREREQEQQAARARRGGKKRRGGKGNKRRRGAQGGARWRPDEDEAPDDEPTEDDRLHQAYAELELPVGSSMGAIRARFRELSLKYHPDRHPAGTAQEQAEARFKRITEAYAFLQEWHSRHAA